MTFFFADSSPARCRIPPSPVLPVCKTSLPAPGTGLLRLPVCKTALSAPRDRFTGVLPAVCQQRAGLRSLRSLRPLPTSTASPLCANLYPSGPSPCPCPGVDTPARRRIPPAPAPPVCKTASLPPGPARRVLSCAKQPFLPPGPARCGFQCAKRPFLPTGRVRHCLSCAKQPFMPPAQARHRLPGANSRFLPPEQANWGRKERQSV